MLRSLLTTILLLFSSTLVVLAGDGGEAPEWVTYLGRFHILMLHLPIGLLLGCFVIEIYALIKGHDHVEKGTPPFLMLGFFSAIAACALGLMLAESGGYNPETLFWHKWMGIAVAVISGLALWLKRVYQAAHKPATRKAYHLLLVVLAVVLGGAGHKGGDLTHGADFLMPEFLFKKEKPADAEPLSFFEENVLPIFDEHCFKCHGSEKQKGDLRMDSPEAIRKGGEWQAEDNLMVLTPGKPEDSTLYTLTVLDPEDDDIMPPKGEPLTKEQTDLIYQWIKDGADFGKWTGTPLSAE
jgi:uncharacterized membrane protein/mono/diheme cytochrome c family protein